VNGYIYLILPNELLGDERLRLSTSLQRNVIEVTVGGVLNRFIMGNRRLVLFFEDIIGKYILICERHGHKGDLRELSKRWGELTFAKLIPVSIKKLPCSTIINSILKKSWKNLGIVDDLYLRENDQVIILTTKNESITRTIGGNEFMPGFFNGIISALYRSESKIVNSLQSRDSCEYEFELTDEPLEVKGKEKSIYNRLNYLEPLKGFTLNDAIRSGIFQLREGYKIYFRGKRLTITENTMFHLVGNANILLDEVPSISYDFFKEIIDMDSTDEQKLTLLKNLLQIMGWGVIKIIIKDKNEIFIEIRNPPYGLQMEKDNWTVLSKIIQGYLWLIDKYFEISDVNEGYKDLKIMYLSG